MRRSGVARRTSDWACDEQIETAAGYVAAVRGATGVAQRARAFCSPSGLRAVLDVLRTVPAVEAPFSGTPAGTGLRRAFPPGRSRFLSRVPVALLRVPASQAEYLRGRPRQALRTNVNRATALGISCSLVDQPAELEQVIRHIAERRSQDPATMVREDVPPGVPRRFIVARDATGEPVALSETILDGRWAGLATLVTVPTEGDGQVLRYLLHAETVRDLIDQGVQMLVVSGSMLLTTTGTRYFQRRTGYEPVWLRPVTAPAARAAVAGDGSTASFPQVCTG
jgi:hypothetical protein